MRRVWPLLLIAAVALGCTGPVPVVAPDNPVATPLPPSPAAQPTDEVVIGVDDLSGGFNPHTMADLTVTGTAVASLVLPSAFHQAADGGWRLNTALLVSALVTDREPFTVSYRIRGDAAWSNGTPIAAEDFAYLAEQMRTQPGVVNSAGYELIQEVISANSGKTVKVIFAEPYPAWRSLFRYLLPAHLLKDAPGGWANALDQGVPVSGGPFVLDSVDPTRNQIVLERNDRYWATPAKLDRIVLRKLPPADLVNALRTGGVQAALFTSPDPKTAAKLARTGLPDPVLVPRPVLARLVLRPAGGQLRRREVRVAVAAALDRDSLLAVAGAAEPPANLIANAQVRAPSQPGYQPTLPGGGLLTVDGSAPAGRLLAEAGYQRVAQGWRREGRLLTVEVAAPAQRADYLRLANRVAVQLRAVGIRATVRSMPSDELVATLADDTGELRIITGAGATPVPAPTGQAEDAGIDIAVLGQPVGADPATVLASVHGCPVDVDPDGGVRPVGLAGYCEPALQPLIEAALTGVRPADAVLEIIEPALWRRKVSIPLYQHASLLVTRPELAGVRPAPLLEGPLYRAADWHLRSPTAQPPP